MIGVSMPASAPVPMAEQMKQGAGKQDDVRQCGKHMPGVGPEKICAERCQDEAHGQAKLGAQKFTQSAH